MTGTKFRKTADPIAGPIAGGAEEPTATATRSRRKRTVGVMLGLVMVASTMFAVFAGSANANPYPTGCNASLGTCSAFVTAINAGSCARMHPQPNYTGTAYTSWCGTNGKQVSLNCYTTGSGDADGHGDKYWWNVNAFQVNGQPFAAGYVNDWYLTTGSSSTWLKLGFHHC